MKNLQNLNDRKATLLVAEDEFIVAFDLQTKLKTMGYDVPVVVSSGEEILEQIPKVKPDIVLLDIMLKGQLDGVETAKIIKEKYKLPVIYLTAFADEKTLDRARITDPFGYVLKPFEERDLKTTIEMGLYRYKIQLELEERDNWLFTTLNSITDGVITTDDKGFMTFLNTSAQDLIGIDSKDYIGKSIESIFKLEDELGNSLKHNIFNVLQNKKEALISIADMVPFFVSQNPSNPKFNIYYRASSIIDSNNNILGIVVVFRDITTSRKYRAELEESHAKFQSLFNSNMIGIIISDIQNKVIETNETFLEILGYTKEDFDSKSIDWLHITAPGYEQVDNIATLELETLGSSKPFFKEYINKQGLRVKVKVSLSRFDGEKDRVLCFIIKQ